MAYNTKPIKNDVDGKPIPQYYNPVTDLYEALQGSNGAANHTLYGADGEPITTTGNKLAVRATEVETLLGTIEGKDFATQATLAQILAKIIAAPATEAKQTALNALIGEVQAAPTANTLLARLKNLETKVDAIIAEGVKLSGSNLTDSGAIPVSQAQKDIVAKAIDNIIETVGVENIKLFLPMWEKSGNKAYDLLDKSLQFDINGASFSTGGLFGNYLTFDGVNDYLSQTPITGNASGENYYNLTDSTYKIATRMGGFTGKIAAVQLKMKKSGTLDSAELTAKLYTDNSGVPGNLVATSDSVACLDFPTTAHPIAFTFSTPYEVNVSSKYWIVLEYSATTGVDESNYISWAYESTNTYGETMAIHDGTNWSAQTGNFVFSVSNDALNCDADWTMIVACLPQNWSLSANYGLYTASKDKPVSPAMSVYWKYNQKQIDYRFSAPSVVIGSANFPLITQNNFTVITQTFSKSASIGKSKLYVNNRLQASSNGTANVGSSLGGLLYLGIAASNTGGFSSYWKGGIGPVILLNKELNAAEVAKVNSNLLSLRKLGVAV